ncbi:MAG: hypothetical protein JO144_07435 [Actinobacteria bacterium]|nr:hypothetical protein [Actinomycetota bacterium]
MTATPPTAEPVAAGGQSVVTIGQFFATLRRQLALVLVLTVLGVALAVGLLLVTPKTYQATALVDVSPLSGGSGTSSVSTITESRIVTSTSVVEAARQTLGYGGTLADLAAQVTVTSPLDSQVLNITFKASSAKGAAAGANAFANAYLDYRENIAQGDVDRRSGRIQSQIADLQKSLATLKAGQNDTQRGLLQNQIQQLQNQLNGLQTSVVNPGELAGKAVEPGSPSSPQKLLYLAGGLLIGLLAGIVTAVVRDRRNDRVRDAAELQHSLGAPVIAEIGVAESGSRPSLAATAATRGAEADAYRTLGTAVTAHSRDSRVVLICGTGQDGTSLAPLNLAATFAMQGLQAVLVGPRRAVQPAVDLLDAPAPGAPTAGPLAGQLVPSELTGLRVLSLGDEVNLGATLRAAGDSLDELLGTADIVVLDGLNVELPSSSVRLGQVADEAIVVAYRNRSTHAELERLGRQLGQVGIPVLGGALLTRRAGLRRRADSAGAGRRRRDEPVSDAQPAEPELPAVRDVPEPVETAPEPTSQPAHAALRTPNSLSHSAGTVGRPRPASARRR